MAQVFRKSSLDKLSNPEQLDRMIRIASPMSWLALAGVFVIVAAAVIWSVFGVIPTTETVSGMIVSPDNACAVYADTAGTVQSMPAAPGDEVRRGDVIAVIRGTDGTDHEIKADVSGIVTIIPVKEAEPVLAGTELARITPLCEGNRLLVCYVSPALAQTLSEGMEVLVYPEGTDSRKYGHMEAEILHVEPFASQTESLSYVLGSGNLVAEQFLSEGPVVSVLCTLKTDAASASGLYWSGKSGKRLTVNNGTVVTAMIVTEASAPIAKLFGNSDTEG